MFVLSVKMFGQKKRLDQLKKDIEESFENVKNDFSKVGKWIGVFDDKTKKNEIDLKNMTSSFNSLTSELEELKANVSFFGSGNGHDVFESVQTMPNFQTASNSRRTVVQTAVQTNDLSKLTVMERAIIFALINSDLKLSYEDLSSMFGKSKSTIRGQINTIKQKIPSIIDEFTEPSGKKRVFISQKMKDFITKSIKIKIKNQKGR